VGIQTIRCLITGGRAMNLVSDDKESFYFSELDKEKQKRWEEG